MLIHGVDFTSAPSPRKPNRVASGSLQDGRFQLEALEALPDWPSFEAWLERPGPWIAALDLPLGLPREGVRALGWPLDWPRLVRHCTGLGREAFRAALDADRRARPFGARYPHRATDAPAGSHSPFKLVNPPVGLMFLAGAPRLLAANISIPGRFAGDPQRIVMEAYPGHLARSIIAGSYKNDQRSRQTPEREAARRVIVGHLLAGTNRLRIELKAEPALIEALVADASGDRLDAVLAALQAAWSWQRRDAGFGLPPGFDPLEGWIATVGRDT